MTLDRVREGSTDLLVPRSFCRKGPGSDTGEVFYNRQMEFGRDLTVALSRVMFGQGDRVLDGLAATGARGIRIANEGGSGAAVFLNDRNRKAFELMSENVALNGLEGDVMLSCKDLRVLLAEETFKYIDIDPFGTPIQFIDPAVQSCRNRGVVAVTATDTAPLCGTYTRTAVRRYGAKALRNSFCHETGLRILIGFLVREAAKHDRGCVPLLCYGADHYFRCHVRLAKGARKAEEGLDRLGYVVYDPMTLEREVVCERPSGTSQFAGPLWTGDLHDIGLLDAIVPTDDLGCSGRLKKMISLWKGEVGLPPTHYVVDELARITKSQPPKMSALVDSLRSEGARAAPTHFDPKGFKTDLSFDEVISRFEAACRHS